MPPGSDRPTFVPPVKRRWNLIIWAGLALALAAFFSYPLLFVRFPVTRDFPWLNLLLFAVAGLLVFIGLRRAFQRPDIYRGKITGSIVGVLFTIVLGVFLWGALYIPRQLPASAGAPRVGRKAPDFALPDENEKLVSLSSLLASSRGAVLIFYRGYW